MQYTITKTDQNRENDVILTINDSYANMDVCQYVLPVPETPTLNYAVTKKEDNYSEMVYNL